MRILRKIIFGEMVPVRLYEDLEEKYENLKVEFRRYREESILKQQRQQERIEYLTKIQDYNAEIMNIILPHVDLKASDRAAIKKIEAKKTKSIFE